jgi:exopolysaccharide biosynthesis polyprenyl glycosylphosphotransferase
MTKSETAAGSRTSEDASWGPPRWLRIPRSDAPREHPRERAARVVARRHGPRDSAVRRFLALADLSGILSGLAFALLVTANHPDQFLWGLGTLPLWIVVFKAYGLYDRDLKRISHATVDDLPWIFHGILLGSLLLFVYYRVAPPENIDMADLATFGIVSTLSVAALRSIARRLAASVRGPERVLLVGEGKEIAMLARKISAHPEYGVEPVGLISRSSSPADTSTLPVLGQLGGFDLEQVVALHEVERIVVAHEDLDEGTLLELLRRCRELGVKMGVLPHLFDALGPSVEVDDVEGITVLGVSPPVLPRSSRFLKRLMDIAVASVLLLLAAPILALIAVAIKLDSRGGVLFRQERVGRGGRRFRLVKFRTMVADAEDQRDGLLADSKDPGWLLLDHDPRVTRVGRLLRLFSLDELPELWNVLKGEMSLVGPRPIVESEDRQLEGWRRSRIDLTPGITGLWQVLGRTSIPFEEMIKLDYLYVTNWSLWTDVRLILRTLPVVLSKRGAN